MLICAHHTISGVAPGDPRVTRHSFEDRVSECAAAGFDGMCLHWRDFAQLLAQGHSEASLREVIARHNIAVPAVEFLGDWFPDTEDARQNRAMAFRTARCFGAGVLNVGADLGGEGIALSSLKPAFADLCHEAADHGVKIALEHIAWGTVSTLENAMALVDTAAQGAGLLIDIWHIARMNIPLDQLRVLDPALILGVQINDADAIPRGALVDDTRNRRFCGEGTLDIAAFLSCLTNMGVTAPIAVEVISPEAQEMALRPLCQKAYQTARRFAAAGTERAGT